MSDESNEAVDLTEGKYDKVWQDIDRFLAAWDASGESTIMNDDWLHELRAGWDRRLDNLYGDSEIF